MAQQDRVVQRCPSLVIHSVVDEGPGRGYRKLALVTDREPIRARYYQAPSARAGTVWIGGVAGEYDGPARNLFGRLASELARGWVCSLRMSYRHPGDLGESVLDVMAAIAFLESLGLSRVGLVGHSFGSAVAIQAGAACNSVRTVVALASQTYGADTVDQLSPRSLLLIHGEEDRTLPPYCSASLYARALEPKRLLLLPGTGHHLGEARDRVCEEIAAWLKLWLDGPSLTASRGGLPW